MLIHERIDVLFAKYLAGDCSAAEWEELLVLVNGIDEKDTEALTSPLLLLWEKAKNKELPSTAYLANREKMYAVITQDMGEIADVQRIPVPWIRWGRLAAAAVVFGIMITGGFYLLHRPKVSGPASLSIAADQVRPGIDKAVLTLSGGQQIILDSTARGTISRQGNTTVTNFNGKLSYNAKDAQTAPSTLAYNTVATAKANQYELVLPDGTAVWLNAVSSIRFPTAFTGQNRTVEMTGEAYFEVARDPTKPFHVKVNGAEVEVLGTHFNINAYTDETTVKTSLLEGSVKVTSGGKSSLLNPGQEAYIRKHGEPIIEAGNVELAVAWKNGYFQFDRAPLPIIMRQIGRWYDLDIKYEGPVPDREFKGKLQRSLPLSSILHLLQKGDIHFRIDGKALIVMQ